MIKAIVLPCPRCGEATNILRRVEAKIDAILRGDHSGWDQALATLREEIRKELDNPVTN